MLKLTSPGQKTTIGLWPLPSQLMSGCLCRMTIPKLVLFMLIWLQVTTPDVQGMALILQRPGCFDSCSKQVNCTVRPVSHCIKEHTRDPNIAAAPVDVQVDKVRVDKEVHLKLSWRPPRDGSYNFLKSFQVDVMAINNGPVRAGLEGPFCYELTPDPDWALKHRELIRHHEEEIVFFLDCLGAPSTATLTINATVRSLPFSPDKPKLAFTSIVLKPEHFKPRQRPYDLWTDINGVVHVIVKNPPKEAYYYEVYVWPHGNPDNTVFQHTYPLKLDNVTSDLLTMEDEDGLHFLITGLSKNINYSIIMDPLDKQKAFLRHEPSLGSNESFNLKGHVLPLPVSSKDRGLDNSLVIILSVSLVLVLAVIVFLVWRGTIRLSRLRNCVRHSAAKLSQMRSDKTNSKLLPIYCHESDHFVRAVEWHMALVQRYLDVIHFPDNTDQSCCSCGSADFHWFRADVGTTDIIIYLSPHLGDLLKLDRDHLSQLSQADITCHQALHALKEQHERGNRIVRYVVTFDCFGHSEYDILEELNEIAPQMPHDSYSELPMPLKLASYDNGAWSLENLDQLLGMLCQGKNLSQHLPHYLRGWQECVEAKSVVRCLGHITESVPINYEEVVHSWEQRGLQTVRDECLSPDYEDQQCTANGQYEHVSSSVPFPKASGKKPKGSDFRGSHEDIESLPDTPLIVNPSGLRSAPKPLPPHLHHSINHSPHSSNASSISDIHTDNPAHGNKHNNKPSYLPAHVHKISPDFNKAGNIQHSSFASDGQMSLQPNGVVSYKPNLYSKIIDTSDITYPKSEETTLPLKKINLNGYVKGHSNSQSDSVDRDQWEFPQDEIKTSRPRDMIIPPSLCLSNSTIDSVCERINKVNENAAWSEINLAK